MHLHTYISTTQAVLTVWDRDLFSTEDFLGQIRLPIRDMHCNNGWHNHGGHWFTLTGVWLCAWSYAEVSDEALRCLMKLMMQHAYIHWLALTRLLLCEELSCDLWKELDVETLG